MAKRFEKLDRDALATMPDRQLFSRMNSAKRILGSMRENSRDKASRQIISLETELCYLSREVEIRDLRKQAHREYMKRS